MKCIIIFTLLVFMAFPCHAATNPQDGPRAIPNNNTSPARLAPTVSLPSLSQEEEGIIRRVDVGDRKVVALTFDLCELAVKTTGYDAGIADFLRENSIPATLFVGGKWMRTHRERMLELMADPLFEIGNHAWSHGNFGIMNEKGMAEQLLWTQAQYELLREELKDAAHLPPVPALFRLPYGRCSDASLRFLAAHGMRVIQWDVTCETTEDNAAPGLEKEVAMQVRPGSILLFHANLVPKNSASLVRRTVETLRAQGHEFATVGALLRMGSPVRTRDGYFIVPGDNLELDHMFGPDGTGRR